MTSTTQGLFYLIAAVCFILALKGLSSPRTARNGNLLGAAGAVLATITVLTTNGLEHLALATDHEAYTACRRGGFLPADLKFDPTSYGIMPNIVANGDPDQFLMLDVAAKAKRGLASIAGTCWSAAILPKPMMAVRMRRISASRR